MSTLAIVLTVAAGLRVLRAPAYGVTTAVRRRRERRDRVTHVVRFH